MKYKKPQELLLKEYLDRHNCLRCHSNENLTIDHIIPVTFLITQLGASIEETFDWDNFQSLCRRCNTLKGGRFDLSHPKTKPLVIKYVNRYCK